MMDGECTADTAFWIQVAALADSEGRVQVGGKEAQVQVGEKEAQVQVGGKEAQVQVGGKKLRFR